MKKSFRMQNLCCANCAAKMERSIKKLEGVDSANIAFMTQRLTIETEEDIDEILEKAQKIVSRIEKDCKIIK